MVKLADDAPVVTATAEGTVRFGLSRAIVTTDQPEGTGLFNDTVQVPAMPDLRLDGEQARDETTRELTRITVVRSDPPFRVAVMTAL